MMFEAIALNLKSFTSNIKHRTFNFKLKKGAVFTRQRLFTLFLQVGCAIDDDAARLPHDREIAFGRR